MFQLVVRAYRTACLHAVHYGHHHVEQYQMWPHLDGRFQPLAAVAGCVDLVSVAAQVVFYKFENIRLVVDNQNAEHGLF